MNGEWSYAVMTECQRFVCGAVMDGGGRDGPQLACELRQRLPPPADAAANRFLHATLLELAVRWGYEQHRRFQHLCRTSPCCIVSLADSAAWWPSALSLSSAAAGELFVAHVSAIHAEIIATHGDPLARRAAALIAESCGRTTFAATAAALGAHPSTLRRAFQREFGMSAREFLARTRIARAEEMFGAGTDAKVEPIAMALGWASKRGLYRAYKQFRGDTPGRARNRREPPDVMLGKMAKTRGDF